LAPNAIAAPNYKKATQCPLLACAVQRRRFPVGESPTRQTLQSEAIGAVMEVTKWLKPSISVSRYTVTARVCRLQRE
jgi:hypothetical protein